LPDSETVFRRLGTELGEHLKRIVDGETGRRASWIGFIQQLLTNHPDFEVDADVPLFEFKQWDGKVVREWRHLKFKDGVDPDSVELNTGYADDALKAYDVFQRLQTEGVIPAGVKYQICSGTPLGVGYLYVSPRALDDFQRVYTRHLASEINKIAAALPHESIAYQWDIAPEVFVWEGHFALDQQKCKQRICESLAEVGDAVSDDIEVGYHLCYGSPADQHILQPTDLGVCVAMANGTLERVKRTVDFVHMPVPKDRNDEKYFSPLKSLKLPAETDLYLGCVHSNDPEGNQQKLTTALQFAPIAGIGSECGWGRGDPDKLDTMIEAHKTLASSN